MNRRLRLACGDEVEAIYWISTSASSSVDFHLSELMASKDRQIQSIREAAERGIGRPNPPDQIPPIDFDWIVPGSRPSQDG